MKKVAILAVLLMASTACSTMDEDMSGGGNEDVNELIMMAVAENKKAAKAGGLWRDANKIIKKAKSALERGDAKKAAKLAKKALSQGKMGQMQAGAEKKAGPWLF